MVDLVIESGRIITPFRIYEKGSVLIDDGKISAVGDDLKIPRGSKRINAKRLTVSPGFIDVHTHGCGGLGMYDATCESMVGLAKIYAKHGTTGFFATLSAPGHTLWKKNVKAALEAIEKGTNGASVLGIHDESPYKHPKKVGAANPKGILKPSVDEFEEVFEETKGHLKLVTIAPELDGGLELIKYLTRKGVASSVGHSYATYDEMCEAIDAGLSHACHTYNGMRELHHREPGVVGAVLSRDEITAELIADNVHVSVPAMKILVRCKGKDKIVLITDSTEVAGFPDGTYKFPWFKERLRSDSITVKEGKAFYPKPTIGSIMPEGVQIAGSAATMNLVVKNIVNLVGVSLQDAIKMASTNAAHEFGYGDRKGSLEPGKDADIIIFDDSFNVKTTIVNGKIVHQCI